MGQRPMFRPRSRAGFTLLELMAVIAIVIVLAALLLPALGRGKQAGWRVRCASNLRQLALAAHLYWDEHENVSFRYRGAATNGGDVWWFGWLERWNAANEGARAFDARAGALHPYVQGRGVDLCPAFDYLSPVLKLKASGASHGYGYNRHLSGLHVARVTRPADTVLLADAAQVNDFQAPASREQPRIEEFFYVSTNATEATAHFRHQGRANAAYTDGHVDREPPQPGSLDARLPAVHVGRLRPECLHVP